MIRLKGKVKRKYLIAIIFILFFLWTQGLGVINFPGKGMSAKSAISSKFKYETNSWKLKKIIIDINIDKKRKLVLYENYENGIMFSYLKKNWLGMWVEIHTTGQTHKTNNYANASFSYHPLKDMYIYEGIIYNKDICKVKLSGSEATIVNDGQFRFWYVAASKDIDKSSIDLELFDSKGNTIDFIKNAPSINEVKINYDGIYLSTS